MKDYMFTNFDFNFYFEDESSKRLVNDLADYFISESGVVYRGEAKIRRAFSVIIANLYYAFSSSNSSDSWCITYSRSKTFYKGRSPGYQQTINVVDWLVKRGWCEELRGFYDRGRGISRLSRLRYTTKLKVKFEAIAIFSGLFRSTDDLIKIKEIKTKFSYINISILEPIFSSRIDDGPSCLEKIKTINSVKRNFVFTHKGKRLPVNDIYRVYNNDCLGAGGRFYGDFLQNQPSSIRFQIRINNEEVVELDFSGLHPRLLYDRSGVLMEGDPYDIRGFDRKVVKQAFQRVLNNKSKELAVKSVKRFLSKEMPTSKIDGLELVDAILDKHKLVLKFDDDSHTCVGLKLQAVDSDIALEVMYHFSEKGIPCIGVHDSFIVQRRYEAELRNVMTEKYEEVMRLEYCKKYEEINKSVCWELIWGWREFKPVIK